MKPLMMSRYDRTYQPPRALCDQLGDSPVDTLVASGKATAWDLLKYVEHGLIGPWAERTLSSVLAAATVSTALDDCADCEDIGFYGVEDPKTEALVQLVRRSGDEFQTLTAAGKWTEFSVPDAPMRIIDQETARELASALQEGAGGLVERFYVPRAWIPPNRMLTAAAGTPEVADDNQWHAFAIVDELDVGAVIDLIRMKPGPELERYDADGVWLPDEELLADLSGVSPPPLVELEDDQLEDVLAQIDANTGGDPESTTAAVSPDPRAEKLRRYWSIGGKGGLKIRWGTPGDWTRCYKHLRKYMGVRAKGYCANLHKRNTGVWTGSRLNASAMSTETSLVSSVQLGLWMGSDERSEAMSGLKDGIYTETGDLGGALRSITAGGFPVAPPDEWFDDPKLEGPTPLSVDDDGHVTGHIATFDVAHIGMPGKVHAPKSRSGYAYFRTGEVVAASGKRVPVGQLTLAGGHAPLHADAGAAVAHYDNTASAVADLAIGEDRYGIWVAGAVRPETKPEQVRALRASAPSGDWRPINGNLELVAICQVNVPGFPVARARVASGAVTALVAAGARGLAVQRASLMADAAVLERLDALEAFAREAGAVATIEPVEADGGQTVTGEDAVGELDLSVVGEPPAAEKEAEGSEDPPVDTEDEAAVKERKVAAARALASKRRVDKARERVQSRARK